MAGMQVAGLENAATAQRAGAIPLPLLERARVASPCPMKWDDLTPTGHEAVRHCGACGLNVYNFAEMNAADAERLLAGHATSGERLCGAIWRRADGTILTRNCPVGWRAARQRALRTASRIAAAIGLLLTGGLAMGGGRTAGTGAGARLRAFEPFRTVREWISPSPPPVMGMMVMGDICVTPTPAPTPNPGVSPESGLPDGAAP